MYNVRMIHQARLYIIGSVQGVGFRAFARTTALNHQITGWVRNTQDKEDVFGARGGVEAVVQGEEDDLLAYIEEVKKGSPIGRVERVIVLPEVPKQKYDDFSIYPTV